MRLLIFTHSLGGGGAERVASTLANRWATNGWIVSVVTVASSDNDRYELHPAIHRIPLDRSGTSAGSVAAALANGRRIVALRRVIRQEKPEVILSLLPTPNVLLAIASTGLRPITIGSERSYPPALPLGGAWETLRKLTYGRLDAVVAPTTAIGNWLLHHTSALRVEVIPNPIAWPLSAAEPVISPTTVGRPERKRILAVGRLGEEKRFAALIRVFSTLTESAPDWELVIVGEGPERSELEEDVRRLGLEDVIHLPGHVGNVSDWFRSADLYVLTSKFEGFPNALLEAMAHGLPAVAVDCLTGPRDIIRPEVDGLLVPPEDDAALATALLRLMHDQVTRAAFAARASEARVRFSLDTVVAAWERLFTGVAA